MMNKTIITISVLILLITAVVTQTSRLKKERETRQRAESNVEALFKSIDSVRTKHNELLYTSQVLELTTKELRKTNSELVEKIKEDGIKIKDLQSIIVSYDYFKHSNVDTVYLTRESKQDSTVIFEQKSPYIHQTIEIDLKNLLVKPHDAKTYIPNETTIYDRKIYRRFMLFFRKLDHIELQVKHSNPYLQKTNLKYIKINEK